MGRGRELRSLTTQCRGGAVEGTLEDVLETYPPGGRELSELREDVEPALRADVHHHSLGLKLAHCDNDAEERPRLLESVDLERVGGGTCCISVTNRPQRHTLGRVPDTASSHVDNRCSTVRASLSVPRNARRS